MSDQTVSPRALSDYLLAHGRPVVTLSEVADLLGVGPKHAASALVRLKKGNQMFSPARGLYVAVPPQYRTWGAVPALDFIDPMMHAIAAAYYVALLSAAQLHGAAHQRPQVFQVMTDHQITDRDFGRVKVRFYQNACTATTPVVLRNTGTGQARVATPAVTAFDLAARPDDGGGLSNVATVIAELAHDGLLTAADIVNLSDLYPSAVARRLGWLLDATESGVDTDPLARITAARTSPTVMDMLQPGGSRRGHHNQRWRIIENTLVEPDL